MLENPILVFAILLLVVLLSPLILRRFKMPSIIVLILFGLVLGPHGTGLIAQGEAISLFSTIGLLYIMFIAGIDLDLEEFRASRYRSILFGVLTFLLPAIGGFCASRYVLGFSQDASLVVACVFSAHTLITYPIASRLGVVKDRSVTVTVGGTIITDIAALFILAIVMGKHTGDMSSLFFARLVVSALLIGAIVFGVFPRVLGWFLRNMEAEKGSQFILVLAILFFSSYLAQVAGFEPIIGAFLAGLAVNPLIPSTSSLKNRIDFMGNTLFIPFFLINVGMSMDFSAVLSSPMILVVAVVLTAASFLSKWSAAFLTQVVCHFSGTQRKLMFGLSGSRAAATLAIFLVGIQAGIMSPVLLNAAVVMIFLTCIVSSVVTEQSARRLVQRESLDLANGKTVPNAPWSEQTKRRPESVLVAVVVDYPFERLVDFSLMLRSRRSSVPLSVGTVLTESPDAEEHLRKARHSLEKYVKEASAQEVPARVIAALDYNVADGIVRLSRESMADAIVMGWPRKLGVLETLIGEHAGGVIMRTDKAVFLCDFPKPLTGTVGPKNRRIVLVAPPFANKEKGFLFWSVKLLSLSKQLNARVVICSDADTYEAVSQVLRQRSQPEFLEFTQWDNFLTLRRHLQSTDLLMVVSARTGSPSYLRAMDQVPYTLSERFSEFNRVVVYPQQFNDSNVTLDSPFTLTVNRAPSLNHSRIGKLLHRFRQ